MGGRVRLATLVCLAVGAFTCASSPALAHSLLVPNTNWTALLPPLPGTPTEPQPGPVPNCEVPSAGCIDTIRPADRRDQPRHRPRGRHRRPRDGPGLAGTRLAERRAAADGQDRERPRADRKTDRGERGGLGTGNRAHAGARDPGVTRQPLPKAAGSRDQWASSGACAGGRDSSASEVISSTPREASSRTSVASSAERA